jgi:3-oxoadipate enol-lactonase
MTPLTFTTTDRVRLAYAVDDFTDPWADAPAVVLLHAAMSNKERFYAWMPARAVRVIRIDMRGHGDSDTPQSTSPVTLERLGRDVLELLDHLHLGRVHVSGSSAGGYVASIRHASMPGSSAG